MANNVRRAINANVYIDGESYLGRAEEINLPLIKTKDGDHVALGMIGDLDYPTGFEKMEMDVKWNSIYPEVYKKIANVYTGLNLQIRSSSEIWEGNTRVNQEGVVIYVKARPKEFGQLGIKARDNMDVPSKYSVTYYKLEINGEEIFELDLEAMIYKVNGEDMMALYRSHLGI